MSKPLQKISEAEIVRRCQEFFTDIGDDAAVLPALDGQLAITTDQLLEGVHFQRSWINATQLAAKCLSVNLSDIAAMGAAPCFALVSAALPQKSAPEWVEDFLCSLHSTAQQYGVRIIGGDTNRSLSGIVLSITAIGQIQKGHRALYRHGVKPGDILAVTGTLGDAAAGLLALQKNEGGRLEYASLVHAQLAPEPEVEAGPWFAAQKGVHAMIDLSDGLAKDLGHLAEASSCAIQVELSTLPLSSEMKKAAATWGIDAPMLGALGGEEYCLAVAISSAKWLEVKKNFSTRFSRPLYPVGLACKGVGMQYLQEGLPIKAPCPWKHFDF